MRAFRLVSVERLLSRRAWLLLVLLSLLLGVAPRAGAVAIEEVWRGGDFRHPWGAAVNPLDGSCWVTDPYAGTALRFARDGTEVARVAGLAEPQRPDVDPADGSCWVPDLSTGEIVHLSADGAELGRISGFDRPLCVAVNHTDHSWWVATDGGEVAHYAADGSMLWRATSFTRPTSVAVDESDGSCWVADRGQVHLLAETGAELRRVSGLSFALWVAVDENDRSCWVTDWGAGEVLHLARDGSELLRIGGFTSPVAVVPDPLDGSVWVSDIGAGLVRYLSKDGTQLWPDLLLPAPSAVAVDTANGSCWVSTFTQVVHLALVRFSDVDIRHWAFDQITACAYARIVSGYDDGTYHPRDVVTRDQMAVYIARAVAGGDAYVPTGPAAATFTDVPPDHWAYRYVEYCAAHGIVQGYGDGYHPDEGVDRAQMAVYVARAVAGGDEAVPEDTDGATFTDVTGTNDWAWCYRYVEYCAAEGIVQGYWDGTYRPGTEVTRDQMAVYIARAFGLPT
jgi:hypothetical protein